MFTGLIESIGTIARRDDLAGGARLEVSAPFAAELTTGESVAVNGVCLTAVELAAGSFAAELSPETLRATSLGSVGAGSRVNLERAVRADARLGGHFVLGHVDTTARILRWDSQGDHWWLEIELPKEIELWVVEKGSIAVDGISLTIAKLDATRLGIQIVPHTRSHTNLSNKRPGDVVNLEADIIGKYAARLADLTRRA
jgi:riboflavin synthase